MKKSYLTFGFILLLIIIAVITNPNIDKHKEAVKAKITADMQKSVKDGLGNNVFGQLGQNIGMMIGSSIIDRIVDNDVSEGNYLIFSTTKLTWQGQTKVVGIGIFDNVMITSSLDDALKQGLLKGQ